jgi:hypothetical protein
MIIERLVRLYAEPDFAFLKNKSEAGVRLYKREVINAANKRDAAREVRN